MLALSRAFEDECCARAQRPVLFAGFQQERHYRASQRRWIELARTARTAVVFADFSTPSSGQAAPLEVPLAGDSLLRREWMLVCDATDQSACLAGWEIPSPARVADHDRRFEAV